MTCNGPFFDVCGCVYQEKRKPLHCAAFGDDGKIIETLVEAKADL